MFAPTRYLDWARRFYGKVRFDLATSGMPAVPLAELGPLESCEDDARGWAALREAIARYNDVPPEEAVATLGATHALWLAYASLASPGDEVLVETPAYEPLVRIAEGVGLRVARFERAAASRFAIDPDRVARALSPRTRLVVVTNLHNPSGARAGEATLAAVAGAAAGRGATLLVDEVYGAFDELVDARGVFRRSARKVAPNVVAVSSLTKCWGLGAARVGWMLGPREAIARADDAITASCGMLPLAHAHLGVRAFGRMGHLAARTAAASLPSKRERVASWARAHGLEWSAPAEGLFGFARVPGAGDLTPAIEAAARDREVLVAAGRFFDVPDGFRVAWSLPAERLDEGLERLAAGLGLHADGSTRRDER